MLQYNPSITGSLTITGSLIVSGNISSSGSITISGSVASASYALSASEASKVQGLGSASFAPAATFNTVSQSYATTSGSLSTRVTSEEATSSVLTSASASFAAQSASLSTRVSTNETNISTLTSVTSSYATTGSNNFAKPQQILDVSNAISFTSTASLYTAGGLRVSKDSFVSGTAYFNNIVVYGTSSIQYITSSQLDISDNIISVNTFTPAVRFGGLAVYDSGSTGLTGSILWDSEYNRWIYSNPSGSTYDGGMLISGPRNTTGLGNEKGTTACYLMAGQGGDHITSSAIYTDTTCTAFYSTALFVTASGNVGVGTTAPAYTLDVSGTGRFCGQINSITGVFGTKGGGSYGVLISDNDQSNVRLKFTNTGTGGQSTSIVGGNPGLSNSGLAFYDETNSATRVYISSGGCVGINTNSPNSLLEVQNCINVAYTNLNTLTGGQWIRVSNLSTCSGASSGILFVATGPGGGNGLATINGTTPSCGSMSLTFGTRDSSGAVTEKMRIVSSGAVAIGTQISAPCVHSGANTGGLIVQGLNGCRGIIEVWDGTTSGKGVFQQVNGTTYLGNLDKGTGTGELQLLVNGAGASATTAMTLTKCGHVVVNNAPNSQTDYGRMTISTCLAKTVGAGSMENTALHLSTCEGDFPFGMKFQIVGDACSTLRYVSMQTGDHYITNQGNLVMQTSGGNVGIGTTTPTTILEVKGTNTYNKLAACFFGTYNSGFAFSDYNAGITYDAGGNTMCLYSNYTGYGGIVLSTCGSPRVTVGINGTVQYGGNFSNGTYYTADTTPSMCMLAAGQCINFCYMSGMLVVNDWNNGSTTLYLAGGGSTTMVGNAVAQTGCFWYNPAIVGYSWSNTSGLTRCYGFFVVRTRSNA